MDQSQNQCQEQYQHTCRSYETFLLANGAENEVSILLRYELKFRLRTIQEALSLKTS